MTTEADSHIGTLRRDGGWDGICQAGIIELKRFERIVLGPHQAIAAYRTIFESLCATIGPAPGRSEVAIFLGLQDVDFRVVGPGGCGREI